MFINEIGQKLIIEGKEYAINDMIVCTCGIYDGKIGLIKGIRTDRDKETENPGVDIYCWLFDTINDAMALTEPIENGAYIIMAPSMIKVLNVNKSNIDLRFKIVRCGSSHFKAVALKEFTTITGEKIKPGDESGLFYNQMILKQKGTNWISKDSYVAGAESSLADNACVIGTQIRENCNLSGNTIIRNSKISGPITLMGDSIISDSSISYAFEAYVPVVCTKESPMIHLDFGQPNLNATVYKDIHGDIQITILREYGEITVFETKKFDRNFYENKHKELLNRKNIDSMAIIAVETLLTTINNIFCDNMNDEVK